MKVKASIRYPAFIEHQRGRFYDADVVMKKVMKAIKESKNGLTEKDIAESINLPLQVVKKGLKLCDKLGYIIDPRKDPLKTLTILMTGSKSARTGQINAKERRGR